MICVTDIKVVDVDKSYVIIHRCKGLPALASVIGSDPLEFCEVTQEMVQGKEFTNSRGEKFCIGMSKQVQDAIGLPMGVFESMRRELDTHQLTISQLRSCNAMYQKHIKEASLMQRLKYLFTRNL